MAAAELLNSAGGASIEELFDLKSLEAFLMRCMGDEGRGDRDVQFLVFFLYFVCLLMGISKIF